MAAPLDLPKLLTRNLQVDIDQALSGIDRLLKSQELTFAFVGVAPALAIVYTVLGSADRLWGVIAGKGHLGGRQRRKAVWEGMRYVSPPHHPYF